MTSLKIKVKYILLFLLLVVVIVFARPHITGKILLARAENYLKEDNRTMANAYYRKYVQEFPENKAALEAFEKVLQQIPQTSMFVTSIYGFRSGPSLLTLSEKDKLEQLNQDFHLLNKYHSDSSLFSLQLELAKINYQAGNIEKAIQLLEECLDNKNPGQVYKAGLEIAFFYLEQEKYNKAEEIIDKLKTSYQYYDDELIGISLWNALLKRDRHTYQELKKKLEKHDYHYLSYGYNNLIDFSKEEINDIESHIFGDNQVNLEGRISRDGKPLGNVFLILQKKSPDNEFPYSSEITHMADYITLSDLDGNYQFRGVEPGEYFLGFGVSYYRIKDYFYSFSSFLPENPEEDDLFFGIQLGGDKVIKNINFRSPVRITKAPERNMVITEPARLPLQWEEYPDAEYYNILSGIREDSGTQYPLIPQKIYGTKGEININPKVFNTGVSMSTEGISPGCVLDYENVPCTIIYKVIAYNQDGQEISESIDHKERYQLKWVPEHQYTEADRLLMDRKYEEAIAAYQEIIAENKSDAHSYKVLGKLYYYGYRFDGGVGFEGKDSEKALEYLTRAYELSNDPELHYYLRTLNLKSGNLEKTAE